MLKNLYSNYEIAAAYNVLYYANHEIAAAGVACLMQNDPTEWRILGKFFDTDVMIRNDFNEGWITLNKFFRVEFYGFAFFVEFRNESDVDPRMRSLAIHHGRKACFNLPRRCDEHDLSCEPLNISDRVVLRVADH